MPQPLNLPATLPAEVRGFLAQFVETLTARLPDAILGLYVRGSLVTGDFRPDSSDIDLLALTTHPVTDAEFGALQAMHQAIAGGSHPFAQRYEVTYMDPAALRRFVPGQRLPTLGQGEALVWAEHGTNWVLERWTLRQQGIVVFGPLLETLIDPIPPAELIAAVRTRLADWAAWAHDLSDPDWQLPRRHKFYVVETMCRALHTMETRTLGSKAEAVAWACTHLPEPWRSLVNRAQAWQTDTTLDPALNPEVHDFVLWTCTRAEMGQ